MCWCSRISKGFSRLKDSVSKCIYANSPDIHDTGSLPSVSLQSEREVVRTINTRTLHEEDLYPYLDQRVQHLEPGDYVQRMDLCHWVTAHPELLSLILFTDETSFTRDGVNNLRNVHTWSHRNPHATCVTHFQRRFSVNVWCGVLGNRLIGPYTSGLLPLGPHEDLSLRNEGRFKGSTVRSYFCSGRPHKKPSAHASSDVTR